MADKILEEQKTRKRNAPNNIKSVPAKRKTRSTSLWAERSKMRKDEKSEISINDLISKNCRLINEVIATKDALVGKDNKIIEAYETLFKAQQDGNRKVKIIACQKKTIDDLKAELKSTKIETFGKDLIDFGRLKTS